MKQQLIFVYNADSGLFNSLNDFAHKIISPSTYQCNLCMLTYGNFSMKQDWKHFIQQLPADTMFLHKNEFKKTYRLKTDLPAVFMQQDNALLMLIPGKEINNCRSLQQLKDLVSAKLKQYDQHHYTNL